MVKLSLSLAETSLSDPEAVVCFFWNVDVRGIAAGEPTLPINTAPLRLWPEGGEQPVWGVTPWGTLVWSDNLPRNANGKHVVDVRLETPPVCFGTVRIAAVAMDALGNQQADPPAEVSLFVNSAPRAPTGLRYVGISDGSLVFSFEPSAQLEEIP